MGRRTRDDGPTGRGRDRQALAHWSRRGRGHRALCAISPGVLTKPNLIYALSGGVLNYQIASYLHNLLDVPLLLLLLVHVVIEVKFSLMRWGFKNQKLLNSLILLMTATFFILILYVDNARI